ncbi:MAG: hypothetical protein IJH71_00855 [Eubacterium sp.]|nr:hypothetical protein [Eubacterium sp.]
MKYIRKSVNLVVVLFAILVLVNLVWFGAMLLGGGEEDDEGNPAENTSIYDDPWADTEQDGTTEATDVTEATEDTEKDQPEKKTTEAPATTEPAEPTEDTSAEDGLYYSQLDEEGKAAYRTLLSGLKTRQETIEISPCPKETLSDAWAGLLMDHVEIFWAFEYHYSTLDGKAVSVEPDYIYTRDEIYDRQKQIESVVKEFVKKAKSRKTDYEKILYVYEYLIKSTDYEMEAKNNQHVDSVLLGKQSVCAGYAKTSKLLLNQLGIEAYYVRGLSKDPPKDDPMGGSHAWNIVKCEGEYYHLDTTWGDPLFKGEGVKRPDEVLYDYLNCDDEETFRTHTLDDHYKYPACNRMEWNYYVVNGRYFQSYDEKTISGLIKKDIDAGGKYSMFKFATEKAYKTAFAAFEKKHFGEGADYYCKVNQKDTTEYLYFYDDKTYRIEVYWTK